MDDKSKQEQNNCNSMQINSFLNKEVASEAGKKSAKVRQGKQATKKRAR